jgi:hypothetical protein
MLVALAVNVTAHRIKFQVSVGDGEEPKLRRVIRMHSNAAEYVPLALVLMLAYEINGGAPVALHMAGVVLILGRATHAWGLWRAEAPNIARGLGQTMTWLTIAALAALSLWQVSI